MTGADRDADKVLFGKDEYLFLTNDTNRTLDQLEARIELGPDFKERWAAVFLGRLDRYATRARRLLFVAAPMKEVVLSRFLPDGIAVSAARPVSSVTSAAAEAGISFLYPADMLTSLSLDKIIYPKGDTHWTAIGAYHVYRRAMKAIGVTPLAERDFTFHEQFVPGDLSGKIDKKTLRVETRPANRQSKLATDNGIVGTGHLKVFENPTKTGTCLVFRDSFTHHIEPMLAETFGRVIFIWQPNIDPSFIEDESPDVILSVMAERFLINVPDDANGPSNAEFVQRKRSGLVTGIVQR